MTNRLISEKIVSWDFAPPFDFTAQFLASRARRRGEQTPASPHKKSRSPIWCAGEDLNLYVREDTGTSSLPGYQLQHPRLLTVIIFDFQYLFDFIVFS